MPDGYAEFKSVNPENYFMDVVISVNTDPTLKYHRENNFTRAGTLFPTNSTNPEIEKLKLIILQGSCLYGPPQSS